MEEENRDMNREPEKEGTDGKRRSSALLQVLVGAYLLYTSWSLKDAAMTMQGKERVLIIAAIVIFTVSGIILLGKNLRSFAEKK